MVKPLFPIVAACTWTGTKLLATSSLRKVVCLNWTTSSKRVQCWSLQERWQLLLCNSLESFVLSCWQRLFDEPNLFAKLAVGNYSKASEFWQIHSRSTSRWLNKAVEEIMIPILNTLKWEPTTKTTPTPQTAQASCKHSNEFSSPSHFLYEI